MSRNAEAEHYGLSQRDISSFANWLINRKLKLKIRNRVLIQTWRHTIALAENLALECGRIGAASKIVLSTDNSLRQNLLNIAEDRLRRVILYEKTLLYDTDVLLTINGPQDPSSFWGVSPTKLAAYSKAKNEFYDEIFAKKIPTILIGIGHLTTSWAAAYGIDYEKFEATIMSSIYTDPKQIGNLAKPLIKSLVNAEEVRIQGPAGTDLSFDISNSTPILMDGTLEGTPQHILKLPYGSLAIFPQEGTAEGKVVFDIPKMLLGTRITNLQLSFHNGMLSSWRADKGSSLLESMLKVSSSDSNKLTSFTIGLNPNCIVVGADSDEVALGTVCLGMGDNRLLGGNNQGDFVFSAPIKRATVTVDGRKILSGGHIR